MADFDISAFLAEDNDANGAASPSAGGGAFDISEFLADGGGGKAAPQARPVQRFEPRSRVSTKEEAIARAMQPGEGETTSVMEDIGQGLREGARGAARAVKAVGEGFVGLGSSAVRLTGTPVRMLTGSDAIHRLADRIDQSYANWGTDAIGSDYGDSPDGLGFAAGRVGEKLAGVAGSLGALGAAGRVLGAAGKAAQLAGKTRKAAALANTLPALFGNDAAVRAYDTARQNGSDKAEAAALASLNGAIHFIGFKLFENKALNRMLGMPKEMDAMMPKWANEAIGDGANKGYTALARSIRNGMVKYTLAERGKNALRAGGIMAVQNMFSDPVMQMAEGKSIDDIDFSRVGEQTLHGLGEGLFMEGALGAAAVLKSPKAARKFLDKIFLDGYDVVDPSGKVRKEKALVETPQGRMTILKQNPDAVGRVLDIVEHGGEVRPEELDAAGLPPDMPKERVKKLARDWAEDIAWDEQRDTADATEMAQGPSREAIDAAGRRLEVRKQVGDLREDNKRPRLGYQINAGQKAPADEWEVAENPGMAFGDQVRRGLGQPEPTAKTEAELKAKAKGESHETGNVRDEAPAESKEGSVGKPQAAEVAKPVEGEPPRAEAPDAGVVRPEETAKAPEARAEAAVEGAGERSTPETSKETPVTEKPVEAASRASEAVAMETKSQKPAPEAKAEPEPEKAQSNIPNEKTPGALTDRVRKNRAQTLRGLLDLARNEDGTYNPDAFRNKGGNGGFTLKDLKLVNEHPEIIEDLGLPAEDAAALRKALEEAYNTQRVATPNSKEGKVSEAGQFNYSVRASNALEKLKAQPDDINALAEAQFNVQKALDSAKRRGEGGEDRRNESYWEGKLAEIDQKIAGLDDEAAKKFAAAIAVQDAKAPLEGKMESGGTALNVAEGQGAKGRKLGVDVSAKDPNRGNRLVQLETRNGQKYVVWRNDLGEKVHEAPYSALEKAAEKDPGIRDMIEQLKQGEQFRASVSTDGNLPSAWTPETQGPLERVAHALRNAVTVGGKRIRVLFVPRPKNADGNTRKSISGIFTGTAADYANRSRQGGVDDGPSLHKVGTGEGNQVYGWGLYGSTVRGVAEGYANRRNLIEDLTEAVLEKASGSNEIALDDLRADKRLPRKDRFLKMSDEEIDIVEKYIKGEDISKYVTSNLYEQTFFTDRAPGDESHLLKWYEPVSEEQLGWIESRLKAEGIGNVNMPFLKGELPNPDNPSGGPANAKIKNGRTVYDHLANKLGSPQAASEFLARAGIDGVKYPVDSYGGKSVKDGDKVGWNYVSFRDDNIRVDHKWENGNLRYMKNAKGETVGEYDAAKGEIRLYPGARVADVVHEFTHPLVDYARAEAKAGRGEFLNKIKKIIDVERETWEQPVRDAYKDKGEEEILEEIFTHAMGEKGADLFGKSTNTLQGRQWYNRLWEAIKGLWQDFATKMGWNKADLRGLDRMSPEDAAQKILSEMAKGRSFGDATTGGEGTRNALMPDTMKKISDAINRYKESGIKFSSFTEAIVSLLERGGTKTIDLPGFETTQLIIDNPPTVGGTRKLNLDHSVFNHNWENGNAYTGYYTWPEFDRAFRDYNLKGIQKRPNPRDGQETWQWTVKYPKTDAHEAYSLTWKIIRDAKTGRMLDLFTTREPTDFPPEHIKLKTPEGAHFDKSRQEDVADASSSGGSARSISQPAAESQGGAENLSSVRDSRRVVLPKPPTTKDVADWIDGKDDVRRKWRRALQDKNIGIRDVEGKLGITDKNESAYYAKDRAFGKNEHELTVLQKQEVEPIVEKIHKSGGSLGLFSAYLYARHAGERNAVLKAEKGVDNGSGMNDAQAKAIFDAVDRQGLRAAFEDAAKDVWAMNRKYLQRRVDAGRMTQAEADFLTKRYQHYVPLRTDMTNEELDIFNSTTGGWKRNETMAAKGRRSAADDPLAFSIVQNEQAIRASNANEVRKRWAGVVRRAKGELGEIVDGVNKGTARWSFTFGDGETVETGSPMKLASERDDIILFKEDGKLKAIKMKPGEHGRGIQLARAVTDKDVAKFNEYLDWIPRTTRWMSAMRTQYVPTFIVRNLKADNLEVMLNALSERGLRGENGRSGGVEFFGKFLKNEVGVAKGVREYFKTGKSSDKYVQEAVENGLLTGGGMSAEGFSETAARLSDTLQSLRERPKLLGGTLKAAKDMISLLNACAEYNTRMGVYKTLREEGVSVADAVSYARDVTVNFNRKGYLTPYTNAAFMFSNAAIQGMGRAFKSMGSEHGKGVLAGLFMVGVAQALLDDWLGHDDDGERTGGADSRNLTEYDKSHSLGVALPTGHRVKTPIRNPWALPMYFGRKTVELLKGMTSGEQAMKDLANEIGQFITEPVGGNGVLNNKGEFDGALAMQSLMPTIADPFVQWMSGKDYKGDDRLKRKFDRYLPDAENGKDSTPEAYKMIAKALNALTGGNANRKGLMDTSPENWKLLTESVFGGVLTDVNNVVKAGEHAADAVRGKSAEQVVRDVPFVRDTFTNMPDSSTRYYEAVDAYNADKAEYKKTVDMKRRGEMHRAKPYLSAEKSRVDALIDEVKKLGHLERGEVQINGKWVERRTPITETMRDNYHKRRLRNQATVLRILGK